MSVQEHVAPQRSNAYELFILVLTVLSLAIMGFQVLGAVGVLPLGQATIQLLTIYDNAICIIFLIDFATNLIGTKPRNDYFIRRRGWLDLLGSIPTFELFPWAGLFRLARLSRLARIMRLLRGQRKKELAEDVLRNRGQYAVFITLLSAMIVLVMASILVLQFESRSPDANITTGGDALWWAFVTITTVGYGDRYPVTPLGRSTAVLVMFAGVGIIGALASILASILVPSPEEHAEAVAAAEVPATPPAATVGAGEVAWPAVAEVLREELAAVRAEVAASREEVAAVRRALPAVGESPPTGTG